MAAFITPQQLYLSIDITFSIFLNSYINCVSKRENTKPIKSAFVIIKHGDCGITPVIHFNFFVTLCHDFHYGS